MNKSGIGIGSTSLVLIFTILCLSIFCLISHTAAANDLNRARAEAELVVAYYQADALAERVLAEIIVAESIPSAIQGLQISTDTADGGNVQTAAFSCPMSERKELYVKLSKSADLYEVLAWKMQDTLAWSPDLGRPVWPGR